MSVDIQVQVKPVNSLSRGRKISDAQVNHAK